jgi:hypothetical protein
MLMTDGGRFAGYGFYLLKGRPVFTWNLVGLERVKWQGKEALAPGKHTLEFDWKYNGPGLGKGGTGTLKVDGKVVDSHPMPRSLPVTVAWGEYFNVGLDTGTSVDDQDYQVPFRFTGKITKLTVKLGPWSCHAQTRGGSRRRCGTGSRRREPPRLGGGGSSAPPGKADAQGGSTRPPAAATSEGRPWPSRRIQWSRNPRRRQVPGGALSPGRRSGWLPPIAVS